MEFWRTLCQFWAQNSMYPSLQNLSNFFNMWQVSSWWPSKRVSGDIFKNPKYLCGHALTYILTYTNQRNCWTNVIISNLPLLCCRYVWPLLLHMVHVLLYSCDKATAWMFTEESIKSCDHNWCLSFTTCDQAPRRSPSPQHQVVAQCMN